MVRLIVCLLVCFSYWTAQLARFFFIFLFFYCSHNTVTYLDRLDGFFGHSTASTITGQSCWDFWPLLSLLKQQLPAVTSGSRWKILYVGLCVFQLGHCNDVTERNGAVKVGKHTDASVVIFLLGAAWAAVTVTIAGCLLYLSQQRQNMLISPFTSGLD